MTEIWKPCVGFETAYEVSNLGNVRRKNKTKNLTKVVNKDGYICHVFCVNNKKTNVLTHRLVAAAFIGPVPIGQIVRHNNGCHTDNQNTNICYDTPKQNSEDMVSHGTQCKGEGISLSKLTEADVKQIRLLDLPQKELANQFNTVPSNISMIKSRKTWKHI